MPDQPPLRIGIVGPLLGINRGSVLSQGEILAGLFQSAGYQVHTSSAQAKRLLRLLDMVAAASRWRDQVDLVNVMVFSGKGFIPAEILAWETTRFLKKPLVLTLHGGNLPDFAGRHPGRVRRLFELAAAIVSPSNYLAHFFRQWGFDVQVIPNVLDLTGYPYRHREQLNPRLLWMRTFHPIYRPQMAIEAFALIREKVPDAKLTMAGADKGLEPDVRKLVAEKGLDSSVRFAGFLNLQQKQEQFGCHDIYLHTNRIDNMPVSVLEAAAFGLPVVATNVGGIPYLLEDECTALLVESGDACAMAGAILRLLDSPELAARLSYSGRKLAEASSWSQIRSQWEALFASLIRPGQ